MNTTNGNFGVKLCLMLALVICTFGCQSKAPQTSVRDEFLGAWEGISKHGTEEKVHLYLSDDNVWMMIAVSKSGDVVTRGGRFKWDNGTLTMVNPQGSIFSKSGPQTSVIQWKGPNSFDNNDFTFRKVPATGQNH